ncbi:bifunctional hydroxymethylpyrimidine kinase/phosphomethylpyrimidine kinase [Marinimicrobium sp. C6131]|uniref:bifunctional hydroxymethylpyrimidine kinase/phosphomethylpyrimidine kinase n=1 Tax=Marinimicrobium sp. C6131 TaxID=3022676 RepID=UPI00223E28A2|nr:bifunctional hydroxymethylpyrimidine kinase/phosphomethylpyrimidine kinase [Marinimicrobium sp. C6131]UZJ43186.1 bifunctional hydroxymethylpyrimidine kinase/phosphomethylpyrimidine kinase [Marinimicrobium sp. C6131]
MNDFLTSSRPAGPPVALTIAGSDSGGGAGIQADLKTFAALGVYGCSALTALTAQNTRGVQAIQVIPSTFVSQQLDSVLTDFSVRAIKTGMLADAATLRAVVAGLARGCNAPVVVDPVMVATSGDRLLSLEAEALLREQLLPRADLLTPNLPEAAALLGEAPASDPASQWRQAERLLALGPKAVLLKGGHGGGPLAQDLLLGADFSEVFSRPRLDTRNTHGSGCTLSAAIAAHLAMGFNLTDSVGAAKDYVHRALVSAADWRLGQGAGPLDHGIPSPDRFHQSSSGSVSRATRSTPFNPHQGESQL